MDITTQTVTPGGLMGVEAQRAIAETQAAMILARQYPRDEKEAVARILARCQDVHTAESGVYAYSKGGAEVSDASIRLAELMAREWGNIQFGIRELAQAGGTSTMQAFAWDIERNVREVREFSVKHERSTRQGTKRLEDSRDIYELTANMGARRLRACILAILPADVKEAAITACRATITQGAPITPEAIERLLEAYGKLNVTRAMLEKRIGRRLESSTPELWVKLRDIYNSVRDGLSVASDWFDYQTNGHADALKSATDTADAVARAAQEGRER